MKHFNWKQPVTLFIYRENLHMNLMNISYKGTAIWQILFKLIKRYTWKQPVCSFYLFSDNGKFYYSKRVFVYTFSIHLERVFTHEHNCKKGKCAIIDYPWCI